MADTDFSRGLVNYTSRDYNSLVTEFLSLVPKLTELWKPEADADPGMVLLKILASTADMLGVNTDFVINELLAPSVTQRKNAEKIFGLIGYELGFYTAGRTEVTFTNSTESDIIVDFGFNGANFCTLNAYTDITEQSRVITYNVLPLTGGYGDSESRSIRSVLTEDVDIFAESDPVTLHAGESVTRVAIEGELRNVSYSVQQIKDSNYIIKLPSQHVDTTAIWIKGRVSQTSSEFEPTRWIQVSSPADFIDPEPRFAVTYDNYSNAQIQISNYLNQLENYDSNWLTIYWFDCTGVIGCVGENVLTNFLPAKSGSSNSSSTDLQVSNLANTVELPHTNVVTGKSPETAKEAYFNSRNYINTFESLVTLPDFNRFLLREPGVDCGVVIDCQKALEINMAIYNDENLTDSQKAKKYITKYDFPEGEPILDWNRVLNLGFDPEDPNANLVAPNFRTYTAMCFAISNDFQPSRFGRGQVSNAQIGSSTKFVRYKPPISFIDNVNRDYLPLQAMSVKLDWGYVRVFNFYVVGQIYTRKPVTADAGATLIAKVKEALQLYFAPANRQMGVLPTYSEIIEVATNADSNIMSVDLGSPGTRNYGIVWDGCDIDYFNYISFARFDDSLASSQNIRISPECLIKSSR